MNVSTKPPQLAIRRRDETILGLLEKLQRHRELDDTESVMMERTVRRLSPPREIWRWSEKEDRLLVALISRRAIAGRPLPFKPNDEIRKIAEEFGRSYMAVHRRIERLRKREKCSDAAKRRKG